MKKKEQRKPKQSRRRWRADVVYTMRVRRAVLVGTRLLFVIVVGVATLCGVLVCMLRMMVSQWGCQLTAV
jgi:hypothetical protein